MRHRDLELAWQHLNVIRELFAAHGSNGLEAEVVAAIELLSGSLSRVATDCIFQKRLGDLLTFTRTLYLEPEGARWQHSGLASTEFLRLQVLKSLNGLESRLGSLQK